MTAHLVRAQLWPARWTLFSMTTWGLLSVIQSSPFGRRLAMAVALMSAASGLMALGLFWSREVRVLPISPDAALRSAWCVAMLMPVALLLGRLTLMGALYLAGSTPPFTLQAIGILTAFDMVYVGCSLVLAQRKDIPWQGLWQLTVLAAIAKLVATFLWMALPFAWPEIVPRTLADVTPVHVAALIVGAVVSLSPVLRPRGQWPSFGVIHDARRPVAVTPPVAQRKTDRWLDRLRGIPRLLPGPLLGAMFVALVSTAGFFVFSSRLREGFRAPFDPRLDDVQFLFIGGLAVLFLAPLVAGSGLTPFLRRLKILPISDLRLSVVLTSLPLMTPVLFWTVCAVAHVVLTGAGPGTWRGGVLIFMCGALALSSAATTRVSSSAAHVLTTWLPIAGTIGVLPFLERDQIDAVLGVLMPSAGSLALIAAFVVNHRTVTRSSSHAPAYRTEAIRPPA